MAKGIVKETPTATHNGIVRITEVNSFEEVPVGTEVEYGTPPNALPLNQGDLVHCNMEERRVWIAHVTEILEPAH